MLISKGRLRLWRLIPVGALLALFWAYVPWIDHWTDGKENAELCQLSGDIRAVSAFLGTTDPYHQLDAAALEEITPIGDRRLSRVPVMELPVLWEGRQIPFREHPSMVRALKRDRMQEQLGELVAERLAASYCDPVPPWAPHDVLRAFQVDPIPVEPPVDPEVLIAAY